jgi:hypothetical protein
MATAEESIIQENRSIPLLLKVIATIIIIEGALGFLFFTIILIYQLYYPDFLENWGYGNYSGNFINLIIVLYAVIHFGLILSAYYLLKLSKKGIYLILLSILMLLATGFLLHNFINWMGLIAAFLVLILLSYYVKSFT